MVRKKKARGVVTQNGSTAAAGKSERAETRGSSHPPPILLVWEQKWMKLALLSWHAAA